MTSIRGVLVSTGLASGHCIYNKIELYFILCAGECVSVRNVLERLTDCLKRHTFGT